MKAIVFRIFIKHDIKFCTLFKKVSNIKEKIKNSPNYMYRAKSNCTQILHASSEKQKKNKKDYLKKEILPLGLKIKEYEPEKK